MYEDDKRLPSPLILDCSRRGGQWHINDCPHGPKVAVHPPPHRWRITQKELKWLLRQKPCTVCHFCRRRLEANGKA